jgi:CHAT domain-containing protein/Tfp pilus assembly protein PilF
LNSLIFQKTALLISLLLLFVLPAKSSQLHSDPLLERLILAKSSTEVDELLSTAGDRLNADLARAIELKAEAMYEQSDFNRAFELYTTLLRAGERLKDRTVVANALRRLGLICQSTGRYAESLDYSYKSLKIAEELGNKKLIGNALTNIGGTLSLQSKYSEALETFKRAIKFKDEAGDKVGQSTTLNNIGYTYHRMGNYTLALDYLFQALRIAETAGLKSRTARIFCNIGKVHHSQGNYAQGIEFYNKCLSTAVETGNKISMTTALNGIGAIKYLQGRYKEALTSMEQGLKLAKELKDGEELPIILDNIGRLYSSEGDFRKAREFYQTSLHEAEQLGDKLGVARSLHFLGKLHYSAGNYQQAIEMSNKASQLALDIDVLEIQWEAFTTLGKAYRRTNRADLAINSFQRAISTIERLRLLGLGGEEESQRLFENKITPYQEIVETLIEQKKVAEGLLYAERAKGRVLSDILRNGRTNITSAMSDEERKQEFKLTSQIIDLNAQLYYETQRQNSNSSIKEQIKQDLDRARLQYEIFRSNLFASHPELRVQRGESEPLNLKELGTLIDGPRKLLIEFVVAEDRTYLFTISRDLSSGINVNVYPIKITAKELTSLTSEFRSRLASRDIGYSEIALRLYNILLKPAEDQLKGKDTICIIPDSSLWELPFQALLKGENRFLIQDHGIFYAPSLTFLREINKRNRPALANTRQKPKTLLALGNPLLTPEHVSRFRSYYRDERLGPLPEAEKEVRTIAELYGLENSQVLLRQDARELVVKRDASKYSVLHFATHGLLDDVKPMYSRITLSRSDKDEAEDGLLEAWEIMKLELNADLTVLSACQTARGKIGIGEGMIGLTWAFFVAGCPTTVASQWKVESSSTTQLLIEFHRELTSNSAGKSEALQKAALMMLKTKNYKHPFYWAGFVMVGNGF